MCSLLQLRTPQDPGNSGGAGVTERASIAQEGPKIRFPDPQIEMAHGAGGKASRRLTEGLFAPILYGPSVDVLSDAAFVNFGGTLVAVTTDAFVVRPLRFPGGSIGELAVNGTVNDLAVSGAKAEILVVTFNPRAACRGGACLQSLRRLQNRGHACRRCLAADLLRSR